MQRIHIQKAEFERVLALGSQCVVPSRALPLSGYVRISVKGDKLKVEAFNELSSIRVYGTLDMETEECSFCVDCKGLENFVKAVSDDDITILLDEKSMTLIHSKGECVFPIVPAEDFPESSVGTDDGVNPTFSLDGATLVRWIGYAKDFVAQDDLRPNISGIYMYCQDGKIGFCATNQTNLITDEISTEEFADLNTSLIINKKAFASIVNVFKDADLVTISVGDNSVMFASRNLRMYIRKTTAAFPNFRILFNNFGDQFVVFRRCDMVEALKRISLCCSNASKRIYLTFCDGSLNIRHDNLIDNKSASEDISYDGDCALSFCFITDNLLKAVLNTSTDEVRMCVISESKPVFITECGENASLAKRLLICPSVKVTNPQQKNG